MSKIESLIDLKGWINERIQTSETIIKQGPNEFEVGAKRMLQSCLHRVQELDDFNEQKGRNSGPVLERLLTYKAPLYPESYWLKQETYTARVNNAKDSPMSKVPANFVDCLVFDCFINAKHWNIPIMFADSVISRYADSQTWEIFYGYRPWTHWNFVQGLHRFEQMTLRREVREMLMSGRDWEKEEDDLTDLEPEYRDETWRKTRNERLHVAAQQFMLKHINKPHRFNYSEVIVLLEKFVREEIVK